MSDYDVLMGQRQLDAEDAEDNAREQAETHLRNEFIDAFENGTPTVATPAYTHHKRSELHTCMSSNSDADKMLALLVIRANKSMDPAMRLLAQAWITTAAREHGEVHARQWMEDHQP